MSPIAISKINVWGSRGGNQFIGSRQRRTVARVLDGLHVGRELNLGRQIVAYRFTDGEGKTPAIALGSTRGVQSVALPVSGEAVLVDLMGNRTTLTPTGGKVSVALYAETPVFVSAN